MTGSNIITQTIVFILKVINNYRGNTKITLRTADAHLTFFSLLVTSLFFFLKANEKLILLNLKPPYRIFFTKYRTVIDFFFPPFFILTDVVYLHGFFIVEKNKTIGKHQESEICT